MLITGFWFLWEITCLFAFSTIEASSAAVRSRWDENLVSQKKGRHVACDQSFDRVYMPHAGPTYEQRNSSFRTDPRKFWKEPLVAEIISQTPKSTNQYRLFRWSLQHWILGWGKRAIISPFVLLSKLNVEPSIATTSSGMRSPRRWRTHPNPRSSYVSTVTWGAHTSG